jgi:hypothetical protein
MTNGETGAGESGGGAGRQGVVIEVKPGDQVFLADVGEEFGAVRAVRPGGRAVLLVYVENGGEFLVPLDAVRAAHSGKVIVQASRLPAELRAAIRHAHDAERY